MAAIDLIGVVGSAVAAGALQGEVQVGLGVGFGAEETLVVQAALLARELAELVIGEFRDVRRTQIHGSDAIRGPIRCQ